MKVDGLRLLCAMATLVCVTGVAVPVPSDEELEKERADIEELTRSYFADLAAGRKTHAEMGMLLRGYSRTVESRPSRYLLARAAFRQYVLGGQFADAEDLYVQQRQWNGVEYAYALARFSAKDLSRQVAAKTPGAKELLDRLAAVEKKMRVLDAAKEQQDRTPGDIFLQNRIGSAYVLLDDWRAALLAFSRAGGQIAEVARFERLYPRTGVTRLTTADVADFWWTQLDEMKNPGPEFHAYRQHAARWYQTAITNGTLRSVKKAIAEKRIAETETWALPPDAMRSLAVQKKGERESAAAEAAAEAAALEPFSLPLVRDLEIAFLPIPAGIHPVTVSKHRLETVPSTRHVTLEQPVWMSRGRITREQFRCLRKVELAEAEKSAAGLKAPIRTTGAGVVEFCDALTKKFKKRLPPGYVFRLPTPDEWAVAMGDVKAEENARGFADLKGGDREQIYQGGGMRSALEDEFRVVAGPDPEKMVKGRQ